ncbi:hypothetical protein ACG04Q_10270 [Roseateles sp. DXS20W]|uniref:DUF3592 domain-containing protein n=1 Tax=Pelomonas lactea TaxID=3299030 RepID=A0ABW7GJC4_9BURK
MTRLDAIKQITRSAAWAMLLTGALMSLVMGLPTSLRWLSPAAAGLGLFSYGFARLRFFKSVRGWVPVDGNVVSAAIEEIFVGGATRQEYAPAVRFIYQSPSGSRESSCLTAARHDHRNGDRKTVEQLLSRYLPNAPVVAYMHPTRHDMAVLERTISAARRSHYRAVAAGGAIVFLVSLFVGLVLRA